MRAELNADAQSMITKNTISGKDSYRDDLERYKSFSKCSNYDTVAMPCGGVNQRRNPFKAKPSSISFAKVNESASI